MSVATASTASMAPFLLLLLLVPSFEAHHGHGVRKSDVDLLEFPLNLEYFEAELFLYASLGYGLDKVAPDLPAGGPPPVGAKAANLSPLIKDVILQFAYQEVGHLKAIKKTVQGFPRPLLNLSTESFAAVIDKAVGHALVPPFDPYASDINFLIASYLVPYVGLTGYVGANPLLHGSVSKRLVAGLLGVESGQDAVIRALLYQQATQEVKPYGITVADFTDKISKLRDELGHDGLKDEGLIVSPSLGAEGKIQGNVLAGDEYSVAYDRTPEQILSIVYGSGNAGVPGGFFPQGGNGKIAKSLLPGA